MERLAGRMEGSATVLRQCARWRELFFYQKAEALYQMTFLFCRRFLPRKGDRTVDQMVQAARASLQELREDYEDYLKSRGLVIWAKGHPRYDGLLKYCRPRNRYEDYAPYVARWSDEEMANTALTLCHMTDRMMTSYLKRLEKLFITQGGIKVRMYAARTGYRRKQDELLASLRAENERLKGKCWIIWRF